MITLKILDVIIASIIIVGTIGSIIDAIGEKMTDFVEWICDKIERHRRNREKRRWERMRNE